MSNFHRDNENKRHFLSDKDQQQLLKNIRVPEKLVNNINQPPQEFNIHDSIFKMELSNNFGEFKDFGTGGIINTDMAKDCTFLSNHIFCNGVHYIELDHFNYFEDVEYGLVDQKDQKLFKFVFGSIQQKVQLKIDFSKGEASLLINGNESEITKKFFFKNSSYKFFVTFSKIGNFCSVNNFYVPFNNNCWDLNLNKFIDQCFTYLDDVLVLTNIPTELQAMLKEKKILMLKYKGSPKQFNDYVYDQTKSILALKVPKDQQDELVQENSIFQLKQKSYLMQAYKNKQEPYYEFLKMNYNSNEQKKNILKEINEQLNTPVELNDMQDLKLDDDKCSGYVKKLYLEYSDQFILQSGDRIKLICSKNKQNQFIVHPNTFNTSTNVNVYLTQDEFMYLQEHMLKNINIDTIGFLNLENLTSVKQFLKNLVKSQKDEEFVYLTNESNQLKSFVYLQLLALNKLLKNTQTNYERKKVNQDEPSDDSSDILQANWLFGEDNQSVPEEVKDKNIQSFSLQNLAIEYTPLIQILLKMEECLYLQSKSYREQFKNNQRNYSSYQRVFTLLNITENEQIKFEQILKLGLYQSSLFTNKLKNQAQNEFDVENYLDQGLHNKKSLLKNYSMQTMTQPVVDLNYSLASLPSIKLKGDVQSLYPLQNGKLFVVLYKDNSLQIFSAKYGLKMISKVDLLSQNIKTPQKSLFNEILRKKEINNGYLQLVQQNDNKKETPSKKTKEEPTKKLDQNKLDQLYKMGFPLSICKAALQQCQTDQLDEAINLIFDLQQQETVSNVQKEQVQEKKTEQGQLIINPEWTCSVCTFINDTSQMTEKEFCQICLNPAGAECYIELINEKETKIVTHEIQKAEITKDSECLLRPDDKIIDINLHNMDNSNSLNSYFLMILFERDQTRHFLLIRLAYSLDYIENLIVVNYQNNKGLCLLGRQVLHSGMEEVQVGELLKHQYFDQAHCILPHILNCQVFYESKRKILLDQNFDYIFNGICKSVSNDRQSSETLSIFLHNKGNNQVQILEVIDDGIEYINANFTVNKKDTMSFENLVQCLNFNSFIILCFKEKYIRLSKDNYEQKEFELYKDQNNQYEPLDFMQLSQSQLVHFNNQFQKYIENVNRFSDQNDVQKVMQYNSNISQGKVKDNDNLKSPSQIINSFKTQTLIQYDIIDNKNCLLRDNRSFKDEIPQVTNSCLLYPSKNNLMSSVSIKIDQCNVQSKNFQVYFTLKTKKNSEFIKKIIEQKIVQDDKKNMQVSVNNWNALPLNFIGQVAHRFSKSSLVSDMLNTDSSLYTFKSVDDVLVFESVHEKIFKLCKLCVKFQFTKRISNALVILIDDLSYVNDCQRLFSVDKQKFQTMKLLNQIPSHLLQNYLLEFNRNKQDDQGVYNFEPSLPLQGRYLVFMCLDASVNDTETINIQKFIVQGDYLQQQEVDDLEFSYQPLMRLTDQNVTLQDCRLRIGDDQQDLTNFELISVQERMNDNLLLVRKSIQLDTQQEVVLEFKALQEVNEILYGQISVTSSNEILNKISQTGNKYIEKLILKYKSNIENFKDDDKDNIKEIMDLLNFLIGRYQEEVIDIYQQHYDFKKIIESLLSINDQRVIQKFDLFFASIVQYSKDQIILKNVFIEILDLLDKQIVSHESLRFIWKQIFQNLYKNCDDKQDDFCTKVFDYICKIVLKMDQLSTQKIKFIQIENLNKVGYQQFQYSNLNDNNQIEELQIQQNCQKQNQKNEKSNYVGFQLQNANSLQKFILLENVSNLNTLCLKVQNQKFLEHISIRVFNMNLETNQFELIKEKQLGLDSVGQLVRDSKQNELTLNFSKYDSAVSVLKIQIDFDMLSNFQYRGKKNTKVEVGVYGKSLEYDNDDVLKSIQKNSEQVFNKLKKQFKQIYGKEQMEFGQTSLQMSSSDNKQVQQEEVAIIQNQDKLQKEINNYIEQTDNYINILINKNKDDKETKDALDQIYNKFDKNQKILQKNFSKLKISEIQPQTNYTFWSYQLDLIFKQIKSLEHKDVAQLFMKVENNLDFLVRLIYNSSLLQRNDSNQITLMLGQVVSSLQKDKIEQLIEQLIQKFLQEDDQIFLMFYENFINNLSSYCTNNKFNFKTILNKFSNEICSKLSKEKIDDVKKILIYSICLSQSDILNQKKNLLDRTSYENLLDFVMWFIVEKIYKIHNVFEQILNSSLCHIFYYITEKKENHTIGKEMKYLFLELINTDYLKNLKQNLYKYIGLLKVGSTDKTNMNLRNNQKKIRQYLEEIIFENVLQEQTELENDTKIDILILIMEFLQQLNSIELNDDQKDIIDINKKVPLSKKESLKREDSIQRTYSNFVQTTYFKRGDQKINNFSKSILEYLQNSDINNERILSILTRFIVTENLNFEIFSSYVKYVMTRDVETRTSVLTQIMSSFKSIIDFVQKKQKNKNKNTLKDISSLMIDGVVLLLNDYKSNIQDEPLLNNLCQYFLSYVINNRVNSPIQDKNCSLPLRAHIYGKLLLTTMSILNTEFNLGSQQNFWYFDATKVPLLENIKLCVQILCFGVDENSNLLLQTFISNYQNTKKLLGAQEVDKSIENMVIWLMLNNSEDQDKLQSVAGMHLSMIQKKMMKLFNTMFKNTEIAADIVKLVNKHFKNIYTILNEKLQHEQIGWLAEEIIKNVIKFYSKIVSEVVDNPQTAKFFIQDQKSLEMIFEILNLNSQKKKLKEEANEHSISNEFISKLQKNQVKSETDDNKNNEPLKITEFGNNLTYVSVDPQISNATNQKNWTNNKMGRNTVIYNTTFQLNKRHLTMGFKMDKTIELRSFLIGITIGRTENYFVVGPPRFIYLYAISNKNNITKKIFLGELEPVKDSGYYVFCTQVYALNPNKFRVSQYENALKELKYLSNINQFEIVIGNPLLTMVDKISPSQTKAFQTLNLSVNFISVNGYDSTNVNFKHQFHSQVQQTFYGFIDTLFNNDKIEEIINEHFDNINKEEGESSKLFNMIEQQLDSIIDKFSIKMSKFLLLISAKNKQMSKIILEFLISNMQKNDIFYSLIEQILKKTNSYSFFNKFWNIGKSLFLNEPQFGSKFAAVICHCLTHFNKKLQHCDNKTIAINIDASFFEEFLNKYLTLPFDYNIERFVLLVLYYLEQGILVTTLDTSQTDGLILELPKELNRDTRQVFDKFFEILVTKVLSENGYQYIHFLSYAALKINKARQYINEENIVLKVRQYLDKKDVKNYFSVLLFLRAAIYHEEFHKQIVDNKIEESLLKVLQKHEDKPLENNSIVNIFLLKTLFEISVKKDKGIDTLENKIFEMLKKNSSNSYFIDEILLKFFNFQKTKNVIFQQEKKQSKELTIQNIVNEKILKKEQLSIESEIFNTNMQKVLYKSLDNLVNQSNKDKMTSYEWKRVYKQSQANTQDSNLLLTTLQEDKPFLILAQCENQNQSTIFGIYQPEPFSKPTQQDQEVMSPHTDNSFLFYYTQDGTQAHYKPDHTLCENFLIFNIEQENDNITFQYDGQEKVFISLYDDTHTIDLYPMKPIENDNQPDFEFPYDVHLNEVEIYQLQVIKESSIVNNKTNFYDKVKSEFTQNQLMNSLLSYYYKEDVYQLQEELSIGQIEKSLVVSITNQEDKQKKLKQYTDDLISLSIKDNMTKINSNAFDDQYNPLFPLFENFIAKGGMSFIIKQILQRKSKTLNEKESEKWKETLQNILELQDINGFLSSMIQKKEFLKVIFELFIDKGESKTDWLETEQQISGLIFDRLAAILSNNDSFECKLQFFEKNVLEKLLSKLKMLTNETSRVYDDTKVEQIQEKKVEKIEKEENLVKEIKKRKGVGYDKEGSGQKWHVQEYYKKRQERNQFLVHLLKLFNNLMNNDFTETQEKQIVLIRESFYNTICESCLLPLLESSFKCSSLHEMAKEFEVYQQYCELLKIIAKNKDLKKLLKKLPQTYKPIQLESLLEIIQKQEDNTSLFNKFSENSETQDETVKKSVELSKIITETIKEVKKYFPEEFKKKEQKDEITDEKLNEILELPLNNQYKKSLSEFRFGLAKMELEKHHYHSSFQSSNKTGNPARMVRLAQEITDLSSSLPIDSYNAIFVRSDQERLDVMKALIAGAEGTPYANGLFEYHVYLNDDYPNNPPKCNLETTGSGNVRFNPNLYSCGKVCLSLLGTWRGNASENWDPKISNLLQLFLSIQAVVMSEEVYFNEPGYEGEAGTEEGEKKNEGYSNIVRLCNVKFAMRDQIKNPIKGFEEVIHRHFYLKRDIIMKEIGKWIKMADVRKCTYTGLVSDHNHKYCTKFNADPKAYINDLKEATKELEVVLKQLVDSREIRTIFMSEKSLKKLKSNDKKKKEKIVQKEVVDLKKISDKIDITYDDKIQAQEFSAEDAKVADRWSRYIGAMGIEAVRKQSKAKVLLVGMNNLGLEIAKNIILSGVNKIVLCDYENLTMFDVLGNFYAQEKDINKNRAQIVCDKLAQLNPYVKVETKDASKDFKFDEDYVNQFDVVVITDNYLIKTEALLQIAEKLNKKIILAERTGVYIRVFCDFGKDFEILDRDGEDPSECFIKDIDQKTGKIQLFENSIHDMREGDMFVLQEIEEEQDDVKEKKSLIDSVHKIKDFEKKNLLIIEGLDKYHTYKRNGKLKQLKVPMKKSFKHYNEQMKESMLDDNLQFHDFLKIEAMVQIKELFLLKEQAEKKYKDRLYNITFKQFKELFNEDQNKKEFLQKAQKFYLNQLGEVHSISAYQGGMVAQEIIKAITNKFVPIHQIFTTDFEEILDIEKFTEENLEKYFTEDLQQKKLSDIIKTDTKYRGIEYLIGEKSMDALKNSKIFMVGSGAIGCELLKNYAMIGLGCGKNGQITLTDPDVIELSNLSRQFLFREKHISKPKSLVASKVVEQMNPDFKNKIDARLEKVCDQTESVFNDEFISQQNICLNALDNIKARVYMDQRCVRNQVPLLESGTLGSKGHVQVIIPKLTENYAQVRDATEETNIPICTLKMFPEENIHCMEWAKDRFDFYFGQNPKSFQRVIEEYQKCKDLSNLDLKVLKKAVKFLKKRPKNIEECVVQARQAFQKYFHNNIKQLLHVYPLDFVTKEGKLFWTLPKRPPVPEEFNTKDKLHMDFIKAYTYLLGKVWGLTKVKPEGIDYELILSKVKVEPFQPKDATKIKSQVEKNDNKDVKEEVEEIQEETEETQKKKMDEMKEKCEEMQSKLSKEDLDKLLKTVNEEIFEKDVDTNGHIDFITAMCNLRVRNYKLKEMEWIQVKLKAGRIVPALATTTAAVSGLQSLEAIKVIKNLELEQYRNAFMNLAIPVLTLSEPGPVLNHVIHPELKVNVWDQWVFQGDNNSTLDDLFQFIKSSYKIIPIDMFKGNKAVYFAAVNKYEDFKDEKLEDLLEIEDDDNCFVSLICKLSVEDKKSLENLPLVKVVLKKK